MRLIAGMISIAAMVACAALVALTSTSASAQAPEYINREYRFMVDFPVAPKEGAGDYVNSNGARLAARVFSADDGMGHYRMTVVRFPAEVANVQAELNHAADLERPKGKILHDAPSNYDGATGRELILIGREGRQIYANVLYYDRILYIVEGDVSADSAPPLRFQTSIVVLDADGKPICGSADRTTCLTIKN